MLEYAGIAIALLSFPLTVMFFMWVRQARLKGIIEHYRKKDQLGFLQHGTISKFFVDNDGIRFMIVYTEKDKYRIGEILQNGKVISLSKLYKTIRQ